MLDPEVFKAYDVRGIHPTQIDEEGAYAIGRAFVEQFEPPAIAVGRDMRVRRPRWRRAVIDGAADGGADVLDLGMSAPRCSTTRSASSGSTAASRSPRRTTRRSTPG
jgi:phosphomannomutase